jgi:hypothetical protein
MKRLPKIVRSRAILMAMVLSSADARTWTNIEIAAISGIIDTDPLLGASSQLASEDTAFLYGSLVSVSAGDGTISSNTAPNYIPPIADTTFSTPTPSSPPSLADEPTNVDYEVATAPYRDSFAPSNNPSASATDIPSSSVSATTIPSAPKPNTTQKVDLNAIFQTGSPTWSPSAQYEATNGNCDDGDILHRLVMYGTTLNEWNSVSFIIKETDSENVVFQTKPDNTTEVNADTNPTPTVDTAYVCLRKPMCYTVEFANETFVDGISWEIDHVVLATGIGSIEIASGTGYGCQFGIGDVTCVSNCGKLSTDMNTL